MAIDTAAKRRSAAGVPFLPLGVGVTPDATPDVFWRQCVAWSYAGIAADSPESFAGWGATRYRYGYRLQWGSPV